MFLIVVPGAGHTASGQRVLLLEWQVRRACVVLGKPTYSLGLHRLPLARALTPQRQMWVPGPGPTAQPISLCRSRLLLKAGMISPTPVSPITSASSLILAPWFTFALSPRLPAGSRRAAWGAWRLAAVRPWHSRFLPRGFPTGFRLLQGHVLPPGQHRSL